MEEEWTADPTKEETGLIFIPGEKDAPATFLTSGGAFKSVCLFAEGFPVGNILHQIGYNVFILKYRADPNNQNDINPSNPQEKYANEDFGRALQYIFENQDTFGVRPCLKNDKTLCYINKIAIGAIWTNAKNEVSGLS